MLSFLKPRKPKNEKARQAEVDRLGLVDKDGSVAEDLARQAAELFGAKIGVATIIDHERQLLKARHGIDAEETARDVSFCGHTILDPENVMCIFDAAYDPRFAGNPLVRDDPNIRFYIGAPLIAPSGHVLGALCAIDSLPRTEVRPEQLARLKELALDVTRRLLAEHPEIDGKNA